MLIKATRAPLNHHGAKWTGCFATPSHEITQEDCRRISKTEMQAQRYCIPNRCTCPWRHKTAKK